MPAGGGPARRSRRRGRRSPRAVCARVMLAIRKPSVTAPASITTTSADSPPATSAARCGGTLAATPMPLPSSRNRTSLRYRWSVDARTTAPRRWPLRGRRRWPAAPPRPLPAQPTRPGRRARDRDARTRPRAAPRPRARRGTRRCLNGLQVRHDLHHDLVGVEEDDVDREPHERRVDRPRGAEEDALARREVLLAEQAAEPAARRVGDDDGLRDDPAVLAAQGQVRDGAHDGRR